MIRTSNRLYVVGKTIIWATIILQLVSSLYAVTEMEYALHGIVGSDITFFMFEAMPHFLAWIEVVFVIMFVLISVVFDDDFVSFRQIELFAKPLLPFLPEAIATVVIIATLTIQGFITEHMPEPWSMETGDGRVYYHINARVFPEILSFVVTAILVVVVVMVVYRFSALKVYQSITGKEFSRCRALRDTVCIWMVLSSLALFIFSLIARPYSLGFAYRIAKEGGKQILIQSDFLLIAMCICLSVFLVVRMQMVTKDYPKMMTVLWIVSLANIAGSIYSIWFRFQFCRPHMVVSSILIMVLCFLVVVFMNRKAQKECHEGSDDSEKSERESEDELGFSDMKLSELASWCAEIACEECPFEYNCTVKPYQWVFKENTNHYAEELKHYSCPVCRGRVSIQRVDENVYVMCEKMNCKFNTSTRSFSSTKEAVNHFICCEVPCKRDESTHKQEAPSSDDFVYIPGYDDLSLPFFEEGENIEDESID